MQRIILNHKYIPQKTMSRSVRTGKYGYFCVKIVKKKFPQKLEEEQGFPKPS